MELSVLSTLIETFTPEGVTFNRFGVAQRGFRYKWKVQNNYFEMDVFAINGIWGGKLGMIFNSWGFGGPLSRKDCRYLTFEECVDSLWVYARERLLRAGVKEQSFSQFKKAFNRWFTLSVEEKLKHFEVTDFYVRE